MQKQRLTRIALAVFSVLAFLPISLLGVGTRPVVFNVKDFGATGQKSQIATQAIQKAIDACARAGGGKVYLPPGEYTSGTLHLRSHVRFYIDSGATLYASPNEKDFDQKALFWGEDIEDVVIEGHGTVDGQSQYVWRKNDMTDWYIRSNQLAAEAAGVPLMRSFPKGLKTRKIYPHLIQIVRCKDLVITGLRFLHSPSWSINLWGCERVRIDGIYVHTSQKYGVWADGIDPDGCKDLIIANSVIETGDDAIVFYSTPQFGPARPCENITITNCRLSSSSSAIKFCDGNFNSVRNVTIDNCVITNSNRGIAFMVFNGGYVANVVISNVVINCKRFPWFWWGNGDPIYFIIRRPGEIEGKKPGPKTLPAGIIRNVIIRNIIAHGEGTCLITGHPESWLKNVSLENIKLFVSHNGMPGYDETVDAMKFRYARNLKVKDVEVYWEKPDFAPWRSAMTFQDVDGLHLEGFEGGPAKPGSDIPALVFDNVANATILNSFPNPGTELFADVKGAKSQGIYLVGNELHGVRTPFKVEDGAAASAVKEVNNF